MGKNKKVVEEDFSSDEDEVDVAEERLAWAGGDDETVTTASAPSEPVTSSKGKGKGKGGKGKGKGKGKGRNTNVDDMSDDDDELVESGKKMKNAKRKSHAASWNAKDSPEDSQHTTLFVKNLSPITHDDDLAEMFKTVGAVRNAFVVLDENKKSRCFAYVSFTRAEDVATAIEEFHGQELQGKKLELSKAKPRRLPGQVSNELPRDYDEFQQSLSAVLSNIPVAYRDQMPALRSWLDRVMPSNGCKKMVEEQSLNAKTICVRLVFSKPQQVARCIAVLNHAPLGTKKNAAQERLRCEVKAVALQGQSSRSGRVMFRNVSFGVDEKLLREHCEPLGKVTEVALPTKPDGSRRGFAFVQFEDRVAAEKAVSQLHGLKLKGRMVAVDFAVDKRLYDNLRQLGPPPEGAEVTSSPLPFTPNASLGYAGDDDENQDEEEDELEIANAPEAKKSKKKKEKQEDADMEDNENDDEEGDEDEDDEEGDDDQEDDAEESEEELIDEETGKKLRKPGFDVQENKTLFMRNLSFEATEQEVKEAFEKYGKVAYVKLVKHPTDPKKHKGSAFVKFYDANAAETVLAIEEKANKKINELVAVTARRGKTTEQVAIEGIGISVKGRRVHILPAVNPKDAVDSANAPGLNKNDSKAAKKEAKHKERTKWFHLLHEGQITENSGAKWDNMSDKEWTMRENSKKERKWRANNSNYVINPLRLSVRGLPWDVDRAALSNAIRNFMMNDLKMEKDQVKKTIDNVIVVKEKRDDYAEAGQPKRSAGYGFASFHDHETAKKVLKWLNGNDKPGWKGNTQGLRPIVEFTLDDKRKLRQQEDAQAKLKAALDKKAKEKGFRNAEEMMGAEKLERATSLKKSKSQRKKEKKLSRGQKQREKRRQEKAAREAEEQAAEQAKKNKKAKKGDAKPVKKDSKQEKKATPEVKKEVTKSLLEQKVNKTAKEEMLIKKLKVLAGDAAAANKMAKIQKEKASKKVAKEVLTGKEKKKAKKLEKRKMKEEAIDIGAPQENTVSRKKRKAMELDARKGNKKKKESTIDDFEKRRFASYAE